MTLPFPIFSPLKATPVGWLTSASAVLTIDDAGWSGYTLRQRIAAAGVANANGSQSRVTIKGSATHGGLVLAKAYIGKAATSGDPYDFATTPTQLLWAGASGVTLAQGGTAVSDGAGWAPASGDDVVISFYFGGPTAILISSGITNWQGYYKIGDDAATVNTSGYTTYFSALAMSLLETFH